MSLTPETVRLWGETLCLDCANSVSWSLDDEHIDPAQTDVLRTSDMFDRWARRLGLFDDEVFASKGELSQVRGLRDAIHRLFASISLDREPPASDVALLMQNYAEAVHEGTLTPVDGSYVLDWSTQDLRRARYAVASDAVGLLQDPARLRRVALCPGRDCGWLFLNVSGRRRWCSMSTCGSREKMRRLYRRQNEVTGTG